MNGVSNLNTTIQVTNLTKSFDNLNAVDDISMTLTTGITGFLGPNGAGKSTTMRLLCGFSIPDSGAVLICGHDIVATPRPAQACIGYLPEAAGGFSHLTVHEFLMLCGESRGFWGRKLNAIIEEVAKTVALQEALDRQLKSLSKGWRQRAWFAQAVLHDPPILILDEPTDGLDPNQKDHIRELIRKFASEKTILLSTHILEEAEEICDRAIILNNGRIVADETPEALADERGRLSSAFRQLTQQQSQNELPG